MFGGKRRRAAKAAVEACSPLIAIAKIREIPNKFWSDPYILGFLGLTITFFAQHVSKNKLKGEDLGFVIINTFRIISEKDGAEIAELMLAYELDKNTAFFEGRVAADKCIAMAYGLDDYDNDPDVIEAKEAPDLGLRLGFGVSSNKAAGFLLKKLWSDVIERKVGDYKVDIRRSDPHIHREGDTDDHFLRFPEAVPRRRSLS